MFDRGVRRLANAMLLQAISDATSRSAGLRTSAAQWMSRPDEFAYSFSFICRVLNRDPDDVRRFCQKKLSERQHSDLGFPAMMN
jgi:hypothetical protein